MAGSYPHPQAPVQPYSELEYDTPLPPLSSPLPAQSRQLLTARYLTS